MRSDFRQYTQRNVETASPGQLVVMLYDGMIRFLAQGRAALERGEVGEAGLRFSRAQAIITELRCSLDLTQGQIATNLASIYEWATDELTAGRVERDAGRINRLIVAMTDLRSAWVQVAATEKPSVETSRPVVGVNLAG